MPCPELTWAPGLVVSAAQKLEEDIDQKRIALEVDGEALNMESGWAGNDATKR